VFEFSVDVVPAVRWDNHWGIPTRDQGLWLRTAPSERWVQTDPEALNDLTTLRNGDLLIAGQGAFVPTVKAVKQIRHAHLHQARPGGLFYEFMLHEGFRSGRVRGQSWADVTASALTFLATRISDAGTNPVCDPALERPYLPTPNAADLERAASKFEELATLANAALRDDKCPAAAKWRAIFGGNGNGDEAVFPLPAGCRADGGVMIPAVAPNVLDGSDEARGFGVG
jgi:hypothetical protein